MIHSEKNLLIQSASVSTAELMQSRLVLDFSDLPNSTIEEYATSAEQISLLCGLNRRRSRRLSKVICRVLYCFRPATLMEHSVSLVIRQSNWAISYRFVSDPIDTDKPQTASALANLLRSGESLDHFEIVGEPANGCTIQLSQKLASSFEPPSTRELKQWVRVIIKGSWEDAFEVVTRHFLAGRAKLKELRDGISIKREILNDDEKQANTLLSLIAGKTDNAVLLLDAIGKIEWVNQASSQTFDIDAKRMLKINLQELFFHDSASIDHEPDLESTPKLGKREFRKLLAGGHSFSVDYFREPNAENSLWVSFQLTPVRDEDDTIVRWIAIGSDVTQRRKAELAMQSAKESAENANQAKSDFLAMMSHEIRTPMNAIIGMTELALGTELTTDQREFLTTVHQSSESLLKMLNDVLDLSKVEAARLTLEKIDFNLVAVVRETLASLEFLANSKNIALKCNLPPLIPDQLRGDPVRIRQVLVNLVGNAIKFTHFGDVEFAIEVTEETATDVTFKFSVRDTGVGIAAEKTGRIFEAFYQTDASVNRNFGGTGLGLAITSELIRLMGGRIWVESKLGVGSKFHFVLTLAKPSARANRKRSALELETQISPDLSVIGPKADVSLQVLVVDDHPSNRKLVCEILRRRGHHCQQATSGKEAIALIAQRDFDVVLMDVQMPEQDGLETTRQIRQLPSARNSIQVPVIAITAYVTPDDRVRCTNSGMNDYLPKPVNSRELVRMVENWGDSNRSNNRKNVPQILAGERTSHPQNIASDRSFTPEIPAERKDQSGSKRVINGSTEFSSTLLRLGGDEELMQQQMRFFMNETPELLELIAAAVAAYDLAAFHLNAHRLKGLIHCYDDVLTASLATTLEQQSLTGSFESAATTVAELRASIVAIRQRIEKYLANANTPLAKK